MIGVQECKEVWGMKYSIIESCIPGYLHPHARYRAAKQLVSFVGVAYEIHLSTLFSSPEINFK